MFFMDLIQSEKTFLLLTADSAKIENDSPVADAQEASGVNETADGVASVSESNEEDSATKDVSELNEDGSISIFSYKQVKSKSTDPAPGIDYMKREVCAFSVIIKIYHASYYLRQLSRLCK